jgi:N-acetylmuramoyl-L-alanine amidase
MMRRLAAATLLALLPALVPAQGNGGAGARRAATSAPARRAPRATPLESAVASMKALMRDRERRRFRHNWERAIAALLAAAKGRDAGAAQYEAARARYALYRWSANELDRDKALLLAGRAAAAGVAPARTLAAAIRREAGDEPEPPRVARPAPRRERPSVPREEPRPEPVAPAPPVPDEAEPDPALAEVIADLGMSAEPAAPAADGEARSEEVTGPADEETAPRAIRRIVVDAGHGGQDPGAIGRRGLQEKDVTLDMARRLAAELKRDGFEVVLTRGDDRFVSLGGRTQLANGAHGDLFVSLHANANPRRNRTGIETYVLNMTDDRYAVRLAARENGADAADEGGGDVRRILTDLNAKASAGSSRRLAEAIQRQLCAAVRTRFGDARDLGVKSALFHVLLGARMPAVLVETGFISNPAEEKRLATPEYRAEVARAVARAVHDFAGVDGRVAAAR